MEAKKITNVNEAREWLQKNRPVPGTSIQSVTYWGGLFDVLDFVVAHLDELRTQVGEKK